MIAGFGFRNSVVENSFDELKEKYMTKYKIDFIATTLDKSKNKAFTNFAKNNNFKIILVNSYKLTEVETLTKSINTKKYRAIDCFCEAVALVAAGSDANIILSKEISKDRLATIAIAQAK
jgi:cobalt-precorrin 5A hydrolase